MYDRFQSSMQFVSFIFRAIIEARTNRYVFANPRSLYESSRNKLQDYFGFARPAVATEIGNGAIRNKTFNKPSPFRYRLSPPLPGVDYTKARALKPFFVSS